MTNTTSATSSIPNATSPTTGPSSWSARTWASIVAGARHRFNEQWLAYAEDNMDLFGEHISLTQVYGVTYTPDAAWTMTGGTEVGQVFDNTIDPGTGLKNPDFDRVAISLAVGYKSDNGIDGKIKGEYRIDDSEDDTRDMEAYLHAGQPWREDG